MTGAALFRGKDSVFFLESSSCISHVSGIRSLISTNSSHIIFCVSFSGKSSHKCEPTYRVATHPTLTGSPAVSPSLELVGTHLMGKPESTILHHQQGDSPSHHLNMNKERPKHHNSYHLNNTMYHIYPQSLLCQFYRDHLSNMLAQN